MNVLLTAAIASAQEERIEKASLRQALNRARKLPSILRLRHAGLRYGQRVSVGGDPDRRQVGRALDFRPLKLGGEYRAHTAFSGPRVEVSAGKGEAVYALRRHIRPARG